jgi:hypothetical protein
LSSDPGGLPIAIDGSRITESTPTTLELRPGQYSVTIETVGYEPLSHKLVVSAGERVMLEFILMKEPPVQPTTAELRALVFEDDLVGAGNNSAAAIEARKAVSRVREGNDACGECHPSIATIQARGLHQTISCVECHDDSSKHVRDGEVIGVMSVARGASGEVLCLHCHGGADSQQAATIVILPEHLQEKRVDLDTRCNQCHHVHAPQKWVFEAREMVGLPELLRTLPPVPDSAADGTKERYEALMETFAIVPLSLGVIGKLAFTEDNAYPSDELLISGVVLVAASYVLGKIFYARDIRNIHKLNAERERANARAVELNERVEQEMARYYREVSAWVTDSEGRGQVNVRKPVPGGS